MVKVTAVKDKLDIPWHGSLPAAGALQVAAPSCEHAGLTCAGHRHAAAGKGWYRPHKLGPSSFHNVQRNMQSHVAVARQK